MTDTIVLEDRHWTRLTCLTSLTFDLSDDCCVIGEISSRSLASLPNLITIPTPSLLLTLLRNPTIKSTTLLHIHTPTRTWKSPL